MPWFRRTWRNHADSSTVSVSTQNSGTHHVNHIHFGGLLRLAIQRIRFNEIAGVAGLLHHAIDAQPAVGDEDDGSGPDKVHGDAEDAATQDHFAATVFAMRLLPYLDIGVFDPSSAPGTGHAIVHGDSLRRKGVGSQIKSGARSQNPEAKIIGEELSAGVSSGKTAGNSISYIVSHRQTTCAS